MSVLVTGGCGFVGSNLVDILVQQGNSVVVVDNLITGNKENCNPKAFYIFEDYREVLKSGLKNYDFDVIFHLAAMPRIQPSFENPLYTFDNNASGTAVLCEFARKNDAKIVYAGSSSFYGGVYLNPYSFSKWVGEELCKMYSKVYGVSSCIVRFFNVYGPRHLSEGPYSTVIGIFERQFGDGASLTVTGDGEQRRDFTHVTDICLGMISVSDKKYDGKIFNLGTGINYSINELASMFRGAKIEYVPKRPGEAKETLADISEINSETGWAPRCDLESYVEKRLAVRRE
tara:strand:- start:415 stop:1275 length:861 start_codon:yes stop_codon:yes gene_type:complete